MRGETMTETTPAPRPDYAPPLGLGLGYVRLEPPRDAADLVCRLCGQDLGGAAWAEAVSDGRGGLYWTAPICDRCKGREGEAAQLTPSGS